MIFIVLIAVCGAQIWPKQEVNRHKFCSVIHMDQGPKFAATAGLTAWVSMDTRERAQKFPF